MLRICNALYMNLTPIVVQVWYCTSSRSHTTIAKYAEYLATSYKEAKENLGKDFSVNPKVRSKKIIFCSATDPTFAKFGSGSMLLGESGSGPRFILWQKLQTSTVKQSYLPS